MAPGRSLSPASLLAPGSCGRSMARVVVARRRLGAMLGFRVHCRLLVCWFDGSVVATIFFVIVIVIIFVHCHYHFC